MAGTIFSLGLVLATLGQILLARQQASAAHSQALAFDDLLGMIASSAGIAIMGWWMFSLAFAFLAALLHRSGKLREADAASKLSPAFMLRIAVAVLGMNLLGLGAANAAGTLPEPAWQQTSAVTAASSTSLPWAPESDTSGNLDVEPRWRPREPVVDPGLLGRAATREVTPGPARQEVVVKDGDSLWSIAAERLGPFATDVEVAVNWPTWYAANRATIGNDPAVLRVGQVLQPPVPGPVYAK
ncbi:LysM peptidoglycan-binding domain-containing protein [Paenarthrobacter sp. NPDC092416]|uniref:LysM peptidoglycan-binding domain-containing protein n=1 Tax=Paenarthrobacter sp. NPDC092416 TaxID=3364386 RepID=UPI0037FB6D8A